MMRFLTLLFCFFLCTCVRAQLDDLQPLDQSPNNPANAIFYLTAEQRLLVLNPDKGDELVIYSETLTSTPEKLALQLAKRKNQEPILIRVSPEGYYVLISKSKKEYFITWFDPESGQLLVEAALGQGKDYLDLMPAAKGKLAIVWNEDSGAWIQTAWLSRDTMSEPVSVQLAPKIQLSDKPLVAHCRAPENRWAGIFHVRSGGFTFNYFSPSGPVTDGEVSLRTNLGPVEQMIYHPQREQFLLAKVVASDISTAQNRLVFNWFSPAGIRKNPPSISPIISNKIQFDDLLLLEDDQVLITGAESDDGGVARIWEASLSPSVRRPKKLSFPDNYYVRKLFSLSQGRVMAIGVNRSAESGKLIGSTFTEHLFTQAPPEVQFYQPVLFDHQGDTVLDANEAATLEIPWRSASALRGHLSARISSFPSDLSINTVANEIHSPFLLGRDSGILQIPLRAGAALLTGEYPIAITISHNGRKAGQANYRLRTRALPQPLLVFQPAPTVNLNRSIVRDQDTVEVTVTVRNNGKGMAKQVRLATPFLPHVAVTPQQYALMIDSIPPDSSVTATFTYNPRSYFQHAELPMNFFLETGNTGQTAYTAIFSQLDSFFLIKEGNLAYVPVPVQEELKRLRGGPSVPSVVLAEPSIKFIAPSENENCLLESTLRHAFIRIQIISPKYLGQHDADISRHVTVLKNGAVADFCFSKFVAYKKHDPLVGHVYELQAEVAIPEGGTDNYSIKVGGTVKEFAVKRSSHNIRKILHIVSVGVPGKSTPFTTTGAEDMYNAITHLRGDDQNSRFFDDFEVDSLVTDSISTSSPQLKQLFESVKRTILKEKGNGKYDHVQHYLLVYFAGHGFTGKEDLMLLASNNTDTLSAYTDIIRPLASVDCQKFFIFDACHSALPAEEIPQRLAKSDSFDKDFAVRILGATRWRSRPVPKSGEKNTRFTTALLNTIGKSANLGMLTSEFISEHTIESLKDSGLIGSDLPKTNSSRNCGRAIFYDYFLEVPIPDECKIRFDW